MAMFNSFLYVYQRVPLNPVIQHHVPYCFGQKIRRIQRSIPHIYRQTQIRFSWVHIPLHHHFCWVKNAELGRLHPQFSCW